MRRITIARYGIRAALAIVLAGQAMAFAATSVRLDVNLSTPTLLTGAPRKTYLKIGLTGVETGTTRRAPVNVAIVLDQSGSMTGAKLEEAKRAAIMAISRLRDDDIVSVVTYQSTVDVLVPATKLFDRESVTGAIRGIRAGGSTALFAGVSKGASELQKFLDRNRVNTLLLLSDGLANVGPSSPGELGQLGASLAREGIAVTTIGLGLQYNEDLMVRLAMASDGNHFFVEDASELEVAFSTEFGDALSTVAQGVTIHIHCADGVRPLRILGREAQITGQDVYASMNQLYRDQTRYLLLEVEVPGGTVPGKVQRIADVAVGYHDLLVNSPAKLQDTASVTFTGSTTAVERERNRDVMVAVVSQIGAERNQVATALRDAGKVEEARAEFESNAAFLEKNAQKWDDSRLQLDAEANRESSQKLNEQDWNRERKKVKELQLKTQTQRQWTEPQKKD